jgi:hypothetical protein
MSTQLTLELSLFVAIGDSGLTIVRRASGKKSQQQHQQLQSELYDSQLEQFSEESDRQPISATSRYTFVDNRLKMQPTSVNNELDSIDLATENLPAVDTPDACDKAALR